VLIIVLVENVQSLIHLKQLVIFESTEEQTILCLRLVFDQVFVNPILSNLVLQLIEAEVSLILFGQF
jgi:hypothetical protein